jgi:heme/copper-type cytochrome/quinol oxidase subunit 2
VVHEQGTVEHGLVLVVVRERGQAGDERDGEALRSRPIKMTPYPTIIITIIIIIIIIIIITSTPTKAYAQCE